jgi:hypothetical protein
MTTATVTTRRSPRTEPLVAALLVAVLAGLGALWAVAGGSASAPATSSEPRVALVVDAGRDGAAALAAARATAARAERAGAADVEVRVPRTRAQAATDVRYFAARGFDRVVAVGPVSGAAAHEAVGAGSRVQTARAVPAVVR